MVWPRKGKAILHNVQHTITVQIMHLDNNDPCLSLAQGERLMATKERGKEVCQSVGFEPGVEKRALQARET